MQPLILIVIVVLLVALAVAVVFKMRKRGLSGRALQSVHAAWAHAQSQPNPTLKIMEADKVLDEALRLLGYSGSLGDKLKNAGPRFSDVNSVWNAHKLRNRLAHELNKTPSDGEVAGAMRGFERALSDLGLR